MSSGGPEFLSSIEAVTGLETPQVVLTWDFTPDLETPLSPGIVWDWINLDIRRSLYRFPESVSEGDSILSEAFSSDPSTSKSDTSSILPLTEYYYSLFLSYREHSASPLTGINDNISRLGSRQSGILKDQKKSIIVRTNGVSAIAVATFTSATALFLTNKVEAGFILQIDNGGADDGFYSIVSVDSETQVTLSSNLTIATGGVDFEVFSDEDRYWISGVDFKRHRCIWRWNATTKMVDFKVNLSNVLTSTEPPIAVVHTGDIGGDNSLLFITEHRYIRIPYEKETPEEIDILNQWDFNQVGTQLTAGFEIVGGSYNPATNKIYILDRNAAEVVSVNESTGLVLNVRTSLIGLNEINKSEMTLAGVAFQSGTPNLLHVANRNYIYTFSAALTSPTPANVTFLTYVRKSIVADIAQSVNDLTDVNDLIIVDDEIDRIQIYERTLGRGFLWQQPHVADNKTIALYHFDESSLLDSSSNGNTAVNSGMTSREGDGKFSGGYEATAAANYINVSAITGEFSGLEGSASLWFKTSIAADLNTGTHYFLALDADASNRVRIGIVAGLLRFEYIAGGTTKAVSLTHPFPDTEWHNYIITWSATDDEVKAYLDGVQVGTTQVGLGVFAGALTLARIGGPAANSALGIYDEVIISTIARTVYAPEILITDANRMHANSGRDYEAAYDKDDPLGFFYRDEVFTPKYFGGDYLIRNDFDKSKLHPPDKTIRDRDELIFRGTDLPALGDLGRTTRMLALLLDRIFDDRELMVNRLIPFLMNVDFMEDFANTLGLLGFDNESWNIDMKRRFLDVMPVIHKRGGRNDSYKILAHLLGFYVTAHTLTARRHWDTVVYSVINPVVQPIYLDQMGAMDTSSILFPLALLRFVFYKQSTKSATGVTSVAASRLLTDASAQFRTTVNIGSLIVIAQGQNDAGDPEVDTQAEYVVTEIHSDTVLKVDRNWEQGGNAAVTYYNYWRVPKPDPYSEFLVTRFLDIAPDSMRVERLDDLAVL